MKAEQQQVVRIPSIDVRWNARTFYLISFLIRIFCRSVDIIIEFLFEAVASRPHRGRKKGADDAIVANLYIFFFFFSPGEDSRSITWAASLCASLKMEGEPLRLFVCFFCPAIKGKFWWAIEGEKLGPQWPTSVWKKNLVAHSRTVRVARRATAQKKKEFSSSSSSFFKLGWQEREREKTLYVVEERVIWRRCDGMDDFSPPRPPQLLASPR